MAQPNFVAAIKVTKENFADLKAWILQKDFLEAASAKAFIEKYGKDSLTRLDDPASPELVANKTARLYLWADPSDADNPSKMTAIYGDIQLLDGGKKIDILPNTLLRGANANFVLFYRMTCCSDLSAIICLNVGGKNVYVIKDSLNGTHAGQRQVFKDKVRVATDAALLDELKHIALHVRKKPHSCDSHAKLKLK